MTAKAPRCACGDDTALHVDMFFIRHDDGTYQVQFDADGILWCRYIGSGVLGNWCRDAKLARAAFEKAQGEDYE